MGFIRQIYVFLRNFAALMKTDSLHKTLSHFKKADLVDILYYFGAPVPRISLKQTLVDSLYAYIGSHPREWLSRMLQRDILQLKRLCAQAPGEHILIPYPDNPSVLEVLGLVQSDSADLDSRELWISPELFSIVRPHVKAVYEACEEKGQYELEQVALGFLHLYGMVPFDFFTERILDYCDWKGIQDYRSVMDMLADSPVLRTCRYEDPKSGTIYVCSPYVFDPAALLDMRDEYPDAKDYKLFQPEEALQIGQRTEMVSFGLEQPCGKKLTDMFRSLGVNGDELVMEQHEAWFNAQTAQLDESAKDLFAGVNERAEDMYSFEEYDQCMHVVADYANAIPKWILKGWSSDELDVLKVDIRADMSGSAPYEDPVPEATEFARGRFHLPHASTQMQAYLDKIVVPHIHPDDPCPCGSGLLYRHCHGKRMN